MKNIWIALYKGKGNLVNRIVRKWTKSQYSHAELILEDKKNMDRNQSFFKSRKIVKREIDTHNANNWDFFKISITDEQYSTIFRFLRYNERFKI